jgi:hypothetical protein
VAISNHRLVSFANEKVTFRWRNSAHNNEQKLLSLSLDEFLRRFPSGGPVASRDVVDPEEPTIGAL